MKNNMLIAAFALAASFATPALAQVSLQNDVMEQINVTGPDGSVDQTVVPADSIAPGDTAVYVMTYTNDGAADASNLVIDNKVPENVEYLGPLLGSENPEVSVDGGLTYAPLQNLTVRTEQGATRPAQNADVTNVRWTIAGPVTPAASGSVSYRARVL